MLEGGVGIRFFVSLHCLYNLVWYKVCWAFGIWGSGVCFVDSVLSFFYDKMGTEDQKPVAEEGHAVGSCEATMVIPVHKVLPFFVSAMLLCVFHYFFKIFLSQYVAEESFHVKLSTLLSVSQNLKVLDEY